MKRGPGRPPKKKKEITEEERERLKAIAMKHGLKYPGPMFCRYCPHRQRCPLYDEKQPTKECEYEEAMTSKARSVEAMQHQMLEILGDVILRLLARVSISGRYGAVKMLNAAKVAELGVKYLSMSARFKASRAEKRLAKMLVKKNET